MRQKPTGRPSPPEQIIHDIKRKTRMLPHDLMAVRKFDPTTSGREYRSGIDFEGQKKSRLGFHRTALNVELVVKSTIEAEL